jgi:hypothetical protein
VALREEENVHRIALEKRGKACLEDLRIDGRIILKWFKKEKPARRRKHIWENNTKIVKKGTGCLEDLHIDGRIILK